jgi:serine protease Do
LPAQCGVVVVAVTPGGPASKAGLRDGDVITEIDGVKTPNGSALLNVVADMPVGKTIRVRVNRDGKEMTFPINIVDRQEILTDNASNSRPGGAPDNGDQGQASQAKLGMRVQPITPDLVRRLRLNSQDGVYVSSVDPNSVAEDAGIVRGTIITRVNADGQRFDIRNMDDFTRAERALKSGTNAAFMVMQADSSGTYRSGFVGVTIP